MAGYVVPNNGTMASVKGAVLATGVAMLFVYLINFSFQVIATFLLQRSDKERSYMKEKLLQTSRVLYWYAIATMFSIFPPFYYGTHSAVLSWFTLIVVVLMHIFCVLDKWFKERSVWSYLYMVFHLMIVIWIIIALIAGFVWSNAQAEAGDELL